MYVLLYEMAPGGLAKVPENYPRHRALIDEFHEREVLVAAGPMGNPPEGALSIFTSREAAEDFAASDPFVTSGAVGTWRVLEWRALFL
jgi:uncharacterized protein